MISTTALFKGAITSSHAIAVRAILLSTQGATGLDPAGMDLQIVSGSVTLDSTAAVRGSLSMVVIGGWPAGTSPTKYVTPYGSEIAVSRGVTYGNGNIERVQLGIFRVDTVEETARGELTITAYDRSQAIKEAQFVSPVQYTAALWTNGSAVTDMVRDVFPGATVTWDNTGVRDTALPIDMTEQTDRLGLIQTIVAQQGMYFYFDNKGQPQVKTLPNYANTASVWTATAKTTPQVPGTLVSTDRKSSRQNAANCVVMTGESTTGATPVVGFAYDNNPASLTYFYGPFGQLPVFLQTSQTSQAAVNSAASAALVNYLGLPMSCDFTSLTNPALEPYDVVTVIPLPDPYLNPVGTGTPETHALQSINIPLDPATVMQAYTLLQSNANIANGHP